MSIPRFGTQLKLVIEEMVVRAKYTEIGVGVESKEEKIAYGQ